MKIYLATNYRTVNPVKQALDRLGERLDLELIQVDLFNIEEQIVPQIIDSIKQANFVIADISKESPNIFFEVGVAQALGKPVLLVSQTNNFNRFSLLSYRFYQYEIGSEGIENLAFRLEQILSDTKEIDSLKPQVAKKRIMDFQTFSERNQLARISHLKGIIKATELEKWIYDLLKEIPGFEVQRNERRGDREYDFIVWNSNDAKELKSLGNPIPIEVKATSKFDNNFLQTLVSKASSQGFQSVVFVSTSDLTEGNRRTIRALKAHSSVAIILVDLKDLKKIKTSKDLLKVFIKSFREYFTY